MNLDLIAMVTMLIIMSLFLIGDLLILIIVWSGDQCKTNEEQYYEDLEQMEYLKNYKREKELKKTRKKGIC